MCEIDSAELSLRVLQCVDPSAGLRFTVQSRIRASNRGVSLRAPCPAWRLNSPASRSRPNRLLQRAINASLQLSLSRICAQLWPAANSKISRARRPSSARPLRLAARCLSSRRSPSVSPIVLFMNTIILPVHPLHTTRFKSGRLGRRAMMRHSCRIAVGAITVLMLWVGGQGALAQKSGGILKMPDFASPASMSIHEEVTRAAVTVLMPVFNNLVLFDQHKERNTIDTIVPDLAESWGWSEDGKELTFKLRHGVKWHDGKPFTAADVKCTWDLLEGKTQEKLRLNPRKAWYRNLDEVTPKGDDEVTFRLKRPQPYLLVLLASGVSPVYPCHVSPAQMRQHPIGTGPFKFVEYKPNEFVKLTRNPDYWKPGRPYLDGLEFPIVASVATRNLMFIADNVDMTLSYGVSMPLLRDIKSQVADAICTVTTDNGARNLIINPTKTPFDNPELRRAVSLTLDRKAFVDILVEGQGLIGGVMQRPLDGIWGLTAEKLAELPGYSSDVAKNRAEARAIMEKLGYGPNKRLAVTVSTRNTAGYVNSAVIANDQIKEIYIDGTLELIETANWFLR